jgi:DNA-binding CsgD family transcriptional regulator
VWTYDLNAPAHERVRASHYAGGDPDLQQQSQRFLGAMSPQLVRAFYSASPPVEAMSRVFSQAPPTPEMRDAMAGASVADAIGLRGHNPCGRGIILGVATIGAARIAPRTSSVLTRLALHLAAASRLRFEGPTRWFETADAIFSAKGRLEHVGCDAEGAKALPGAVKKRLAANAIRSDPAKALELWRALIAGQWSIVDHADRDGKRFILARRNAPDVREPAALTARERLVAVYAAWGHSNRLIEYETGLSQTAISVALTAALRKLRLRSRADLIQWFRAAP